MKLLHMSKAMRKAMCFVFSTLVVLMQSCGAGSDTPEQNRPEQDDLLERSDPVYFFGFLYDPEENTLEIKGTRYKNVYQASRSASGEYIIFSTVEVGHQPELFLVSENGARAQKITDNEFIEFDPVINDRGDFAYALHEQKVNFSKVFINGQQVDLPQGLYKNLAVNNDHLVMHRVRLDNNTNWLVIYDLEKQSWFSRQIGIWPDYIAFDSDGRVVMEGLGEVSYENDIFTYDISGDNFEEFYKSDDDQECFLRQTDRQTDRQTHDTVCFKSEDVAEQLLFLGLRSMRKHDPTGALACSNNHLGRLSWNASYRLYALLVLVENRIDIDFPINGVLKNMIQCLLMTENEDDHLGWPTKKYSISGQDTLSLLVDDAMVLFPLLKAVNLGLVDEGTRNQIISIAEDIYDYHESSFVEDIGSYHFEKGISFWADGVVLPWNQQNIFGLALAELYNLTGDSKYKDRVLDMAAAFEAEFEYGGDGPVLWHYWPLVFYDGWTEADDISTNTPFRNPTVDTLYEDFSHAGWNVKFVSKVIEAFPNESPFPTDLRSRLVATLDGARHGEEYSCFISGDADYQPPARRCIPRFGWIELGDRTLAGQISHGLPMTAPLFEGDFAVTYLIPR